MHFCSAQGYVYVNPSSIDAEPNGNNRSNNSSLNQIFDNHQVEEYKLAFPGYSRGLEEWSIMYSTVDISNLLTSLHTSGLFDSIYIEDDIFTNETIVCNEPYEVNDPLSKPGGGNYWVTDGLDLECAWSIANGGCGDGLIGFVDREFEVTHDELTNQIIQVFGIADAGADHGTKMAGAALAEGNNNIGMAGINPGGRMIGYVTNGVPTNFFNMLGQAGMNPDVDIINLSWCLRTDQSNLFEQIINNGKVIVVSSCDLNPSATNGGIGSANAWPGVRSLPGVVYVSGVRYRNGIIDYSPSTARNSDVDILAPASDHWRPDLGNSFSQFPGPNGNSNSTAHMTGVLSLLHCENPCLLPGDYERILEKSGKHVPAMDIYPGELGAGLISAEQAVMNSLAPEFDDVTDEVLISIPTNIYEDLHVKSGGTLTITSTVHFNGSDVNIIVEKGGKLILNDAHLRNGCDNSTWGGIVLHGDPLGSQYPFGNNFNQAFMTATNSIIEDAETAVNISDGQFLNNGGGGICIANGVDFINCRSGISMDNYPLAIANLGHGLLANRTRIQGCNFTIDNNYAFENFQQHVLLDQIHTRVSITGSNFSDSRTVLANDFATLGIWTNDSKFWVGASSTFENLSYGIKAYDLSTINNFIVQSSLFDNCFIGISARNVPFFSITNNIFLEGGYTGSTSSFSFADQHTGLIIDRCTGFAVEENTFDGSNNTLTDAIGILSRNTSFEKSLTDFNEITGNTFTQLRSGNLANENNGGDRLLGGLVYKCNENLGDNFEDITVAFGSIARDQSFRPNTLQGVDNIFSNFDNGNPFSDINNATQGSFMRYFFSNSTGFDPIFSPTNLVLKVNSLPGCIEEPEDPCTRCDKLLPTEVESYQQYLTNNKSLYLSKKSSYLASLDGGNTTQLVADLSSPSNWTTGKTNATNYSPFVSYQAGQALLLPSAMPVADKLDIYILNPELLQVTDIWNYILENINLSSTPLSSFESARITQSNRGSDEQELTELTNSLKLYTTSLVRHYLFQDESTSSNLNAIGLLISDYFPTEFATIVDMQNGDFISASSKIVAEQATGQNTELWDAYAALNSDLQNNDYSFNSTSLVTLANTLMTSTNTANQIFGENVLAFGQHIDFQNEGILSNEQMALRKTDSKKSFLVNNEMTIFPNPSNGDVVQIVLPQEYYEDDQSTLRIHSITGAVMGHIEVKKGNSSHLHDVSEYLPGIYFVECIGNGRQRLISKLIIQ